MGGGARAPQIYDQASLKHIRTMEKILKEIEQKIKEKVDRNYKEEYELLQTIPGVKENASTLVAEIGVDMDIFTNEIHLSSPKKYLTEFDISCLLRDHVSLKSKK